MMSVKPDPIPEGYGTVTPWISTKDTARVIDFLKAASAPKNSPASKALCTAGSAMPKSASAPRS
jgi:hypothetical protein